MHHLHEERILAKSDNQSKPVRCAKWSSAILTRVSADTLVRSPPVPSPYHAHCRASLPLLCQVATPACSTYLVLFPFYHPIKMKLTSVVGWNQKHLFYIIDIMVADDLLTQGAKASATMILTMLTWSPHLKAHLIIDSFCKFVWAVKTRGASYIGGFRDRNVIYSVAHFSGHR